MDYSQPKIEYLSEVSAYIETLEILEEQKNEVKKKIRDVREKYLETTKNLGIKEGKKVRVDFPESEQYRMEVRLRSNSSIHSRPPIQSVSTIYGYIEAVTFFDNSGNLKLTVTLPTKEGKRLRKLKPQSIYTGIKPEWVTVLPDDFNLINAIEED